MKCLEPEIHTDKHQHFLSACICVHLRLKNDERFWIITSNSCTGRFTQLTGGKVDTSVKPAPTTPHVCNSFASAKTGLISNQGPSSSLRYSNTNIFRNSVWYSGSCFTVLNSLT